MTGMTVVQKASTGELRSGAEKKGEDDEEYPGQSSSYRKILVGYDGSKNARRALARASLMAAANGASLRILVVVNVMVYAYGPSPPNYPENYFELMFEDANKQLAQALDSCKDNASINASGIVEEGHPAETILDVAKRERADLIVIGRRGISGVQRFLMGGVSSSVVGHSDCDVLVVK
jgi:nucleotide-binding universal stress UspA family protein